MPKSINEYLPPSYKGEIGKEIEHNLEHIKTGIKWSIAAKDYTSGANHWVRSLRYYLRLNYPLTVSERDEFASDLFKIFYDTNDPHVRIKTAQVLGSVLR